jgi:hypothetical protein
VVVVVVVVSGARGVSCWCLQLVSLAAAATHPRTPWPGGTAP